jgi:two-component system, NtrC family, sensor kinase
MSRFLFSFINRLQLRWKMMAVVLPLVIAPIVVVGTVVGYIGARQAHLGITQTSMDDLEHMAAFTIDLLDAHHRQFELYKKDKEETINEELATLVRLAHRLVESQHHQYRAGNITLATAQAEAGKALRQVNVGESGYLYAVTSAGDLMVHIALEGENIYNVQDETGRYFIREISQMALESTPGEVLFTTYPWRNPALGDIAPRSKIAAFLYFPEWDWIIAAGGYIEETYEKLDFERRSFEELKSKIKNKNVGRTGYIFAMDSRGNFTIHPHQEGINHFGSRDSLGNAFIREMCLKQDGWIRYPWKGPDDAAPRMKVTRYAYFAPWDWIVGVGSYEDEFYSEAKKIKGRVFISMLVMTLLAGSISVSLVFVASARLTDPIHHMIGVIRKVKKGRFDERMEVDTGDELGELAVSFNRMTDIIRRNKELEATLAQHGKMASLGVLSSGVAHEINNPLGVILGYAAFLEGKIPKDDPIYGYIHEIKKESKRCKKIVQDLLSYARTPKPTLEETDLNELLGQIIDFSANHVDLHHIVIERRFAPELPPIQVDGDQMRQVAINLILNAGAAMQRGGRLLVQTTVEDDRGVIVFSDTGEGIPEEHMEQIFEPFFTTKERGTGLGLAITRQIIELHHGTIHLESAPGKGTTVTIRLPLQWEEY